MRSIMHNKKDSTCYLCMMLCQDYSRKFYLEEHHAIYGNGKRKKSEEYGLKVYLCPEHHRTGRQAVHMSPDTALRVKKKAQEAFEACYPELVFREIFGKNYIMPEERQQLPKSTAPGFRFLQEETI